MLVHVDKNMQLVMTRVFCEHVCKLTSSMQTYLMVTVDVRDFNDPPVFLDQRSSLAVTEVSMSHMLLFSHTQ